MFLFSPSAPRPLWLARSRSTRAARARERHRRAVGEHGRGASMSVTSVAPTAGHRTHQSRHPSPQRGGADRTQVAVAAEVPDHPDQQKALRPLRSLRDTTAAPPPRAIPDAMTPRPTTARPDSTQTAPAVSIALRVAEGASRTPHALARLAPGTSCGSARVQGDILKSRAGRRRRARGAVRRATRITRIWFR